MNNSAFTDTLLDRHAGLWQRMLDHPFLQAAHNGELDDDTFNTWLRQDYLFVEAAIPFVGSLIASAPDPKLRSALAPIPTALEKELDLFRERAAALGVSVDDVEPGFVNHAYVQFLLASGDREDFPAAFTVYWAAEKAYHESWKVVDPAIDQGHPWRPFVENWAGEEFAGLVHFLEGEVNRLAEEAGEATRRRMEQMFEMTTRYEIAFWQMAWDGPEWPGV